ncbi:hypothetical protein KKB43_02725, partial [Patescibacteria group bacterium]|nr:hypothetical protein [Patescibacteria group bacterium]
LKKFIYSLLNPECSGLILGEKTDNGVFFYGLREILKFLNDKLGLLALISRNLAELTQKDRGILKLLNDKLTVNYL